MSNSLGGTFWVVSVPNDEKHDEDTTRSNLTKNIGRYAKVLPFDIPYRHLKV